METRGSQTREMLADTGMSICGSDGEHMKTLLLFNGESRKYEIWECNDTYAGYVVVAYGKGYEFCHEASDAECAELGDNESTKMGSKLVDICKGKTWREGEDAIAAVMSASLQK